MNSVDQVTGLGLDALRKAIIVALTGSQDEEALLKEHYDNLQDLTNISKKTLKRFFRDKAQIGPQTRNLLAAIALGKEEDLILSLSENQNYYLDFLNSHGTETVAKLEEPTKSSTWHFGKALASHYEGFKSNIPYAMLSCVRKNIERRANLSGNLQQEISLNAGVLARHSRLLITGEAGMGKSYFARNICFSWSQLHNHESNVPIYIDLKSPAFNRTDVGISSFILSHYFESKMDWMVLDYLERNVEHYFFVLDGFDDLTTIEKNTLMEELKSFSKEVSYVILSREYGFQDHPYPVRTLYEICGFNLEAQELFIRSSLTEMSDDLDQASLLTYIHSNELLSVLARCPMHLYHLVCVAAKTKSFKLLQGIRSGIELRQLFNQYVES